MKKIILISLILIILSASLALAAEKEWTIVYCDLADARSTELKATSGESVDYAWPTIQETNRLLKSLKVTDLEDLSGKTIRGETLESAVKKALKK